MGKCLSDDLRERVIAAIEDGASRRQSAARFGVSASSAIRWMQAHIEQGTAVAKRQGGDRRSARVESQADFLLAQVDAIPDITLMELQALLKERGLSVGIGSLWRFFERREITFKKNGARRRAGAPRRRRSPAGLVRRTA